MNKCDTKVKSMGFFFSTAEFLPWWFLEKNRKRLDRRIRRLQIRPGLSGQPKAPMPHSVHRQMSVHSEDCPPLGQETSVQSSHVRTVLQRNSKRLRGNGNFCRRPHDEKNGTAGIRKSSSGTYIDF